MTILVCTDFSAAAAVGEREAAERFPGAALVIFHGVSTGFVQKVVDRTGMDHHRLRDMMLGYADERLAEVIARLRSQGRQASAELAEGDPVDLALAAARRHAARLLVVGAAAGDAVGRFRTTLVRRARLPLLLVFGEE